MPSLSLSYWTRELEVSIKNGPGTEEGGPLCDKVVASVEWLGRGSNHASPPSLQEAQEEGALGSMRTSTGPAAVAADTDSSPVPATDMKSIVCFTQDHVRARW